MSATAIQWLTVFHLFGVLVWVGTMMSLIFIFDAHARAELSVRPAFHALERRSAIQMDVGATIAIVFGALLLANVPGIMKQGYMHAKLLLVVVVFLGGHVVLRIKVRKFRESQPKRLPIFLPYLVALAVLAVMTLILVKPF